MMISASGGLNADIVGIRAPLLFFGEWRNPGIFLIATVTEVVVAAAAHKRNTMNIMKKFYRLESGVCWLKIMCKDYRWSKAVNIPIV